MTIGTGFIFDTETTGIPDWKAPAHAEHQPRLLAIAGALIDDQADELDRFYDLVKPDGFEVDEEGEAFQIHGLKNERLHRQGKPIVEVLSRYLDFLDRCNYVSAYGLRFDQKIVRGELRRLDMPDRYGEVLTFDMMFRAQKLAREKGWPHQNPKKLAEVYLNLCGEPAENMHSVQSDLDAEIKLMRHLIDADMVEPREQKSNK